MTRRTLRRAGATVALVAAVAAVAAPAAAQQQVDPPPAPPPAAVAPPAVAAPAPRVERIGTSVLGRPIEVVRSGDPAAPRKVLVVGCIHGDEPAGRAVVDVLRRRPAPPGVELVLVRDLNPDGVRRHTRVNAHGVDLNRNGTVGRRFVGPPGSLYYAGPRPFSEPESRAIRALILRTRPVAAVWYHQPYALVDRPEVGGDALTRRYAAVSGLPARQLSARPGSLSWWENARVRPGSSIVVELPAGTLTARDARRHAGAVLAIASLGAGQTPAGRRPARA